MLTTDISYTANSLPTTFIRRRRPRRLVKRIKPLAVSIILFFRLKSTCSLRLWCFTHHATSSKGTSIMVGFVYLLLAYLHATSLLIFYFFFPCRRLAIHLPPSNKRLRKNLIYLIKFIKFINFNILKSSILSSNLIKSTL